VVDAECGYGSVPVKTKSEDRKREATEHGYSLGPRSSESYD